MNLSVVNPYESDRLLSEYLCFHYGSKEELLPWAFGPHEALGFPVRCVAAALENVGLSSRHRALDVGCAVGGACFELSRSFEQVVGIDYSQRFIDAAEQIRKVGRIEYLLKNSGASFEKTSANLPEGAHPSRIVFETGDAHSLRTDLKEFNLVIACNLLCRLSEPARFLARLKDLVVPGGTLLITTPHTWSEEFTAEQFWLDDGLSSDGEPVVRIQSQLGEHFRLNQILDLPFLIREHRRKYQWSVAQASIWTRRPI